MQVSERLTYLLKERIKLKHILDSTDVIQIRDVKEVTEIPVDGSRIKSRDYEVLYNFKRQGINYSHCKGIFNIGPKSSNTDMVNSPDHYKKRYIREVIQSIKGLCTPEEYRGYLKGSKIKYLARYQDKGGIEDLEKGQWYGAELIAFEKEQINKNQEATQ